MSAVALKNILVICSTDSPIGNYMPGYTADYLQGNSQQIIRKIYGPYQVEKFIAGEDKGGYFPQDLPDKKNHFDGIVFLGCNCIHQLFESINSLTPNIFDEKYFINIYDMLKDDGIICFIERKDSLKRFRNSMKQARHGNNVFKNENEHIYNSPDKFSYTTVPLTRLKRSVAFNSLINKLHTSWSTYFKEIDRDGNVLYIKKQLIKGGNKRRKRKIRKTRKIRKSRI